MTRSQKSWTLLVALCVLWAWLLWDEYGAAEGTAEAAVPGVGAIQGESDPGPDPGADPRRQPSNSLESLGPPVAGPEVLAQLANLEKLSLRRNPFLLSPAATVRIDPGNDGDPVEHLASPARGLDLTSTILGGRGSSAVVDGVRYRVGEIVPQLGEIAAIGHGWVDVTGPDGRNIKMTVSRKRQHPGKD